MKHGILYYIESGGLTLALILLVTGIQLVWGVFLIVKRQGRRRLRVLLVAALLPLALGFMGGLFNLWILHANVQSDMQHLIASGWLHRMIEMISYQEYGGLYATCLLTAMAMIGLFLDTRRAKRASSQTRKI